MDLYNIVTKIPYLIMLGIGLVIVLQVFVGGLNDLSANVDESSLELYNISLAAEGILNLGDQRGHVPIEYFQNEGGDPGFERRGEHCYFDEVTGLDGENVAFRIISENFDGTADVQCLGIVTPANAYHVRLNLINGSERIPATVSVYEP